MKVFNTIAGIFAVGGSLIATAYPAEAKTCYSATAAWDYAHLIRGGASHEFAWEKAVIPYHDGSNACQARVQSSIESHWRVWR